LLVLIVENNSIRAMKPARRKRWKKVWHNGLNLTSKLLRRSPVYSPILSYFIPEKRTESTRKTATRENIQRFGGPLFVLSRKRKIAKGKYVARIERSFHESGISYVVEANYSSGSIPLCCLKIGFDRQAVIIEAMQGEAEFGREIKEMNQKLGKPWANYLLQCVETDARRAGYTQVKIRRPETLYYYEHGVLDTYTDRNQAVGQNPEVQKRMREMYGLIAKRMGYRKEGDFFVKDL
jgi:hypothetical protein